MRSLLSRLMAVALLASTSHAFLSPSANRISQRGHSSASGFISSQSIGNTNSGIQRIAIQSSRNEEADSSNTINIAIFSNSQDDVFQNALLNHPFCKMTGVTLSIDLISTNDDASWTKSELDVIHAVDIACFSTVSSVKTYLNKLDNHLNVDPELPQEERRKLPNKPDLIGDIIGSAPGATSGLKAACPVTETARECLNSGRWIANDIYYPKDGKAVELKTQSLEEGEENANAEEDLEIDVDTWAASVMQAAGDVLESKFWGGGW